MQSEIATEAASLIKRERGAWDTATAFVTERVAFQMRNLIRQLRRNYYGVFEEPVDPQTGQKKIWMPLTEFLVESAVKNIDLDTKDINFRSKNGNATGFTSIVRAETKCILDKMGFGEKLDMSERQMAIDGTFVWKTTAKKVGDKWLPDVKLVDLLNIYIDPTVESIAESETIIERALMTPEEIAKQKDWVDNQDLLGATNLNRYDGSLPNVPSTSQGTAKLREVYERWGLISKYLITGKKEDKDTQVEGRIIASSMGNDWVTHLIEANTKTFPDGRPWRPYEECWFTKIHGRWYGKGIGEKVLSLQWYLNAIANMRLNRSRVQQLGLFKIKANSGITPAILGRLAANGGIKVNNMDDIQPLEMSESGIADSFNDEKNIQDWAQKVTSLYEVATGEDMPASTPATNASIQSRAAQSQFVLIKEGIGMFLQRWIRNHVLPIVAKNITKGSIVRLTGEPEEMRELDEIVVNKRVYEAIDALGRAGQIVTPETAEMERQRAIAQLASSGKDRFVTVEDVIDAMDYDVEVYITNEEFDKGVMSQNLITMLQAAGPEYATGIVRAVFDLMGLDTNQLKTATPMQPQMMPGTPGNANPPKTMPMASMPQMMQDANTMQQ